MANIPIFITPVGQIATVNEGDPLSVNILYSNPGSVPLVIQLVSGELPPGLIFDSSIGLIYGTVQYIDDTKDFNFTIRLSNPEGTIDRNFFIRVISSDPVWSDPSNLATIGELSRFEYQLSVTNPGGYVEKFEKIEGSLPPGIILTSVGLISGFLSTIDLPSIVYSFKCRAYLSNGSILEKDLSITVVKAGGNSPPVWLTISGTLGSIYVNQESYFAVSAIDPEKTIVTYSLSSGSLPPGLSLSSNGNITGVLSTGLTGLYSFTIAASDGMNSVNRTFSISTNPIETYPISWITNDSFVGTIKEAEPSFLYIKATSTVNINYSIIAGALPLGLYLNNATGDIYGSPIQQLSDNYYFTIRAANNNNYIDKQFYITVTDQFQEHTICSYLKITGTNKFGWLESISPISTVDDTRSIIKENDIFRPYDPQFGVQQEGKILLANNLLFKSKLELTNALRVTQFRIKFKLGSYKKAIARKSDGSILYELIYREVIDSQEASPNSFVHSQTLQTVYPAGIHNIRNRLINLAGFDGPEYLPSWMTSLQDINDSDSALGWIKAIPVAYMKPETADLVIIKLNNADTLIGNTIEMNCVFYKELVNPSVQEDIIFFVN